MVVNRKGISPAKACAAIGQLVESYSMSRDITTCLSFRLQDRLECFTVIACPPSCTAARSKRDEGVSPG